MKTIAFATLITLSAFLAHAEDKPKTAQQALMGTCQKEATASGKKGKDRQAMVNECLSNGKKQQQEKMKVCAAENKGKKGDEYKKAQKECLSK